MTARYPEFRDKSAIVTGAASGIGRAAALGFARNGANVIVADLVESGAQETVSMISKAGGRAIYQRFDAANDADNRTLVERAKREFGRLDYAFNNAGISPEPVPVDRQDEEIVDRLLAINLKGVWSGLRYQIPAMLAGGGGAIVNTASVTAMIADPGRSIYAATKAGVVAMTRVAAVEYCAKNIRINALCPGVTETGMLRSTLEQFAGDERSLSSLRTFQPIGRWAQPSEMSEVVLFLCSDSASFIVGQALIVDGGLSSL